MMLLDLCFRLASTEAVVLLLARRERLTERWRVLEHQGDLLYLLPYL